MNWAVNRDSRSNFFLHDAAEMKCSMKFDSSFNGKVEIIDLPKIPDRRGNLTFVEGGNHVPFNIGRVYYLYDVPAGEMRAGHAHFALEQVLIAVSGAFDVLVDIGTNKQSVSLNRPYVGLYIRSMVWREIYNFSSGSVCLVIASLPYDEADYIRSYDEFIEVALKETHKK